MAGEGGPIEQAIGECQCPGTPHAEDVIWWRAKPDFNMGSAAQVALRMSGSYRGDTEAALLSVLVRYGVVAWNIRNAEGPVPVTTDAVLERLGWGDSAIKATAKARELYWDKVLAPLVPAKSEPAQPTPRDDSTSANQPSSPRTRTSSAQSSRSAQEAGTP